MKKQKVTINDIAKELGISPSSVSRALSDYQYTSEKTKLKVRKVAKNLGYRPNAIAAALRNSKSKTIGLIVPRISMFFQSSVITAIQNRLNDLGYNIIICQSNESPDLEKKNVEMLLNSRVEGLIVSSSINTVNYDHFNQALQNDIPLIFYDRVPLNFPCHKIKGDEYHGAFNATNHLIEQGCKRIVHIGGLLKCLLYQERYNGYKDALKMANIELNEELVFFQELNWENAIKTCKVIFNSDIKPDGVFSSNDTTALAVIKYAKSINVKIPEELKIVGYSNDSRATISHPTLTSVEQFPHEMGEQAAELMIDLIQNKTKNSGKSFISKTLYTELIQRESSQLKPMKSKL